MKHDVHPDAKLRLLAAIAAGDLSPAEVAQYLGVHRMKVWRWLRQANIDPEKARAAYVIEATGRWLGRRPVSKKELRARANRAARSWSKNHEQAARENDPQPVASMGEP